MSEFMTSVVSNAGYMLVSFAFASCLVSITAFFLYYRDKNEQLYKIATKAFYAMTIAAVITLISLVLLIMTHQFQFNYVYSYSSTALNKFYLFATLWAGQEGTLLMWLTYGCIYGILLIRSLGRKMPLALVFLGLVQGVLLWILHVKNPFPLVWHTFEQVPIGFFPQEGAGLNPLLQNPWMVIHPPTLFVGYSSTVVAFAIAMSALVTGDRTEWVKAARPWVVFNVMILGTGIIMGGYWAYITLGWGGYWGWDPVENASLVPWLFSVVLLHGILIQSKRGSLVKSNLFFAGASFLTMVWGSYLTRSGVLTDFSVHSFAPSGLNFYLVMFQLIFTGLFLGFFIRFVRQEQADGVESVTFGDGFLNRETFMLMGILVLLLNAIFVLLGTSAPLYTRLWGDATSVAPDFYNTMTVPIAFFILLGLGIAPLLAWKTSELRNVPTIIWSAGIAAMATVAAMGFGLTHLNAAVLFFMAMFVISVNLRVVWLFLRNNFDAAGGYLAHVGWAFMAIGIITSSMYESSEKILLPKDTFTQTDLGYEIKFLGFRDMPDGKDQVRLMVKTADQSSYEANPRFYYSDYSKAFMITPDVKMKFGKDVYISPISFTPAELGDKQMILLSKGQSTNVGTLQVTFNDFITKMGASRQEVTADLKVVTGVNSYGDAISVQPVIIADQGQMNSEPVDVPGTDYRIAITRVNANNGQVELEISSPSENQADVKDTMAIELREKPLISILWFGTLIFVFGSMLSLRHRVRRRRKD
ncbi:MAG: heme lyase CcmF/NrfE family subunit [Calditrichia bacterium]